MYTHFAGRGFMRYIPVVIGCYVPFPVKLNIEMVLGQQWPRGSIFHYFSEAVMRYTPLHLYHNFVPHNEINYTKTKQIQKTEGSIKYEE